MLVASPYSLPEEQFVHQVRTTFVYYASLTGSPLCQLNLNRTRNRLEQSFIIASRRNLTHKELGHPL